MIKSRLLPGTSRRELTLTPAANEIVGYGAVFYDAADAGTEYWLWSDIVERIMPGAFDRALHEDDVRCFFNHDANYILGRTTAGTLSLSIDAVGLRYTVTPSDSAIAQHALEAVRRRDCNGSSFMFEVGESVWIEQKPADEHARTIWIREIREVRPLYEIGPVNFPAYESTTADVAGSRSDANESPSRSDGATRWQKWYGEHVTRARASLDVWRTSQTLLQLGAEKTRRQRERRAFDRRNL